MCCSVMYKWVYNIKINRFSGGKKASGFFVLQDYLKEIHAKVLNLLLGMCYTHLKADFSFPLEFYSGGVYQTFY